MIYHFTEIILNFLSSIAWPIIVIIIFIVLKSPLSSLLSNLKKISYGGTSFETLAESSQKEQITKLENSDSNINNNSNYSSFLAKFSAETNAELIQIVDSESNIGEITDLQSRINQLYDYSKLLVLLKNFERIYTVIFGSQIRILQ